MCRFYLAPTKTLLMLTSLNLDSLIIQLCCLSRLSGFRKVDIIRMDDILEWMRRNW